jgi:hypothetical protein
VKPPIKTVEAIEPQIIACPVCGKSNRVFRQSQRGRFKCGACKASLPNPFTLTRRISAIAASIRPGLVFHMRTTVPLLVVISIAVIVAFLIWSSPRPAALRPAPRPAALLPPPWPAAPLPPPRRLANGEVIGGRPLDGHGNLEIDNGTANDAVIKVVDGQTNRSIEVCYVTSESKVSIDRIPDGVFSVFFATGVDFDSAVGGFTREKRFSKFVDPLNFTTDVRSTASSITTQYTIFTLTLHPVVNGNARTSDVSEDEFLKL